MSKTWKSLCLPVAAKLTLALITVVTAMGMTVSCAEGRGSGGSLQAQASHATDPKAGRFYMARVCPSSESGPAQRARLLPAVDPSRTEGREDVCVQGGRVHSFVEDVFRIYPVGEHENYIELKCADPGPTRIRANELPGQGELALVAGERVMATYRYLDRNAVLSTCGRIRASDLHVAVDICEDVMLSLDRKQGGCTRMCDARAAKTLDGVCLVVNAAAPALRGMP